jgi:radical SAM superfamily enzyme YgiQ (UPF0313 family)
MGMVDLLSHTMPTNLGYVAAFLLEKGHEVEIWDYEVERFTIAGYLDRIRAFSPDVIGLSCMTPTIENGAKMAALTKSAFPEVTTVVGGAHSSALPRRTLLEYPAFDVVVNKEGEETMAELCDKLARRDALAGTPGITHREHGGVTVEPDRPLRKSLDDYPFPARHLYQARFQRVGHSSRGFPNQIRSTEIFTSRGCPYQCTFCAIVATFGRSLRLRSIVNVEREIRECQARWGIEHVIIADDTFGLKKGRVEELCAAFRRTGLRSWSCDTRVDCVDPEKLRLMVESGCTKVAFGVETGSERVVKLNRKKIDFERVRAAVRWSREAGIRHVEGNFIIASHPDETWDDVKQTMALMHELPFTFVSISVLVPYPGTENYEIMDQSGLIHSKDWPRYVMFGREPCWRTTHFSAAQLIDLQKVANRAFYLHPRRLLRLLSTIRSPKELGYYLRSTWSFLRWLAGGASLAAPESSAELDRVDSGRVPVDPSCEDRIHGLGSPLAVEPELIRGPALR